ncbi:MAG: heparinase II/III family protein [Kiloniellales bacterium]
MSLGATHHPSSHGAGTSGEHFAALRAFVQQPRQQLLARLSYGLRQPLFRTPLYRLLLAGRGPTALKVTPSDPWPGNAEAGSAIIQGNFTLLGSTVRRPMPLWLPIEISRRWSEEINSFSWLRDLRAAGGDTARRTARQLVAAWVDANRRWHPITWDPQVTGRRLANWLGQYDFFAASADVEFRHRLLREMAFQARHLNKILPAGLSGGRAIGALKGLIYAGICLPDAESCRQRGLTLLRDAMAQQILADGGHIERSPRRHLEVLRDLIDLRAALVAAELEVPDDLHATIEQMAPVLRLLQHGDGGLALFNDSGEEADWQVDLVLQRAGGRGRPLASAPISGFQRLQAGRSLLIVDAGAPAPSGFDEAAHAGTLSFEMSVGRERLIVNCGAQASDGEWRTVQRGTAAHSALVVAETNSSQVVPGDGLGRRPNNVTCRREETEGSIWLELSHDGYLASHGLVHHRRLYLSSSGEDLRGEDRLEGKGGGRVEAGYAVRFHLHPAAQASLSQSGDTVLLRLPRGDGWRFYARGAELRLQPSIYLGMAGTIRRSQQIVLSGATESGAATIKWAMKREAKPRAKR